MSFQTLIDPIGQTRTLRRRWLQRGEQVGEAQQGVTADGERRHEPDLRLAGDLYLAQREASIYTVMKRRDFLLATAAGAGAILSSVARAQIRPCSLARNPAELEESAGLTAHCHEAIVEVIPNHAAWPRMVARIPTPAPSSFGYFHSPRLVRRLRDAMRQTRFDLVFARCTSVAPYVEEVSGPVKILDYGDIDSQKWREYSHHRSFPLSAGYWLEAVKLEHRERQLCLNFDMCTCTTRVELDSLRKIGVTTPSDWFPNGVDTEYFAPNGEAYDGDLLAFLGRMDYYQNQQGVIDFCRHVLPELRRRRPATRFSIVGADPPRHISASGADARGDSNRLGCGRAPLRQACGTHGRTLANCARHSEQDSGIHGDGRSGRVQSAGVGGVSTQSRANTFWWLRNPWNGSLRSPAFSTTLFVGGTFHRQPENGFCSSTAGRRPCTGWMILSRQSS